MATAGNTSRKTVSGAPSFVGNAWGTVFPGFESMTKKPRTHSLVKCPCPWMPRGGRNAPSAISNFSPAMKRYGWTGATSVADRNCASPQVPDETTGDSSLTATLYGAYRVRSTSLPPRNTNFRRHHQPKPSLQRTTPTSQILRKQLLELPAVGIDGRLRGRP